MFDPITLIDPFSGAKVTKTLAFDYQEHELEWIARGLAGLVEEIWVGPAFEDVEGFATADRRHRYQ